MKTDDYYLFIFYDILLVAPVYNQCSYNIITVSFLTAELHRNISNKFTIFDNICESFCLRKHAHTYTQP